MVRRHTGSVCQGLPEQTAEGSPEPCNKTAIIRTYQAGRHKMRGILNAADRFGQLLANIVEARLPLCVWLDFTALDLFKTRS